MSRSWSITELRQQLWAYGSQLTRAVSQWGSPQYLLLGLTLVLMTLAGAWESPFLFLLAMVQGVILFRLPRTERVSSAAPSESSQAKGWTEIRQMLPDVTAVQQAASLAGTVLYRMCFRGLVCVAITLIVGLATLSWFVLNQPELWQWRTLETAGPPLGAVLVTGVTALLSLLISGWIASRRSLLPQK